MHPAMYSIYTYIYTLAASTNCRMIQAHISLILAQTTCGDNRLVKNNPVVLTESTKGPSCEALPGKQTAFCSHRLLQLCADWLDQNCNSPICYEFNPNKKYRRPSTEQCHGIHFEITCLPKCSTNNQMIVWFRERTWMVNM